MGKGLSGAGRKCLLPPPLVVSSSFSSFSSSPLLVSLREPSRAMGEGGEGGSRRKALGSSRLRRLRLREEDNSDEDAK